LGEWVECAETLSHTSKIQFQHWAKKTQVSLPQAEAQQETCRNIQTRIQNGKKCKSNSRKVVQIGGVITVKGAREKKKEMEEKKKAASIRKARKNIQIAVNKAKAALNRHGIAACKAEKDRKKQVRSIESTGGRIPPELLIPVADTEKTPSA